MDTTTVDFNTLTLLVAIMGSTLTIVTMMVRQSGRHEDSIKSVNTNVASLETRVTALETKFDVMGRRFDVMDRKLDAMDGKFDAMDGKFDAMDGKFDTLAGAASETRERLARVEEHLEDHGRRLSELSESSRERGHVLGEVRERLARVEGYLMAPEDFRMRGPQVSTGLDPSPQDPGPDHRQAG